MVKFIIEATDNRTGRPVYAKVRRGCPVFAKEGAYVVDRKSGQDNPYAYYDRAEAEELSAGDAMDLMTQLGVDIFAHKRWVASPRILLALDLSVPVFESVEP